MKNIYRTIALSLAALSLVGVMQCRAQETVLYRFTGYGDGDHPTGRLVADKDGALYGTTHKGGDFGAGTVFKLKPPAKGKTAWKETVLWSFIGYDYGSYPAAGLTFDDQRVVLYGTTKYGGYGPNSTGYGTVFKLVPPAPGHTHWTETDIYDFCSVGYYCDDGEYPATELVVGRDGALYGTTTEGGAHGYGTVFRLAPPAEGATYWNETVLYSFCATGYYCDDGNAPQGITFGKDGALYGTTSLGGSSGGSDRDGCYNLDGCGTVFKLTPPAKNGADWTHTVLYNFCSHSYCADGSYPLAAPIFGKDGRLYGTTSGNYDTGEGTIFRLTPTSDPSVWTQSTLHSFGYCPWLDSRCADGANAEGTLIEEDGIFYGTTARSIDADGNPGRGTVFQLTPPPKNTYPAYWVDTVLHTFTGNPDGAHPQGRLLSHQGVFYGTTYNGGTGCESAGGCGTVYKLTLGAQSTKTAAGDLSSRDTDSSVTGEPGAATGQNVPPPAVDPHGIPKIAQAKLTKPISSPPFGSNNSGAEGAPSAGTGQNVSPANLNPDSIRNIVQDVAQKDGTKAVEFGIWQGDRELFTTALGHSMTEVPAATNMHYRIGGIAETFMSTLLLMLEEQGRIDLNQKISLWFPNLLGADQVTVRMLVSDTAGYIDYVTVPAFSNLQEAQPFRTFTDDELINYSVGGGKMQFAPGTDQKYSHTDNVILGQVIERATHESIAQLYEENIFKRMRMTDTSFPTNEEIPGPVLHAFTSERKLYEDCTYWNPSWGSTPGLPISDLADIGKWGPILGTGRLISAAHFKEQIAPWKGNKRPDLYFAYGFVVANGWIVQNPAINGYSGAFAYNMANGVTITVAATKSETATTDFAAFDILREVVKYVTPNSTINF